MKAIEIARIRHRLNWSQTDLGAFLGITRRTVSRLELGQAEAGGRLRECLLALRYYADEAGRYDHEDLDRELRRSPTGALAMVLHHYPREMFSPDA